MAKRLTKKLITVAAEIEQALIADHGITAAQIQAWRTRAHARTEKFPVTAMVNISDLWIDYEVQRDVIHKHVIKIMRYWDPQICSPVSGCRLTTSATPDRVYTYDGQHRTVAAAILGYQAVPCAVVETTDANFASYAFEMLNDTGVKRLTPGDLHRNALVRHKNGSRDIKVVRARVMQDQFDTAGVDLQDKNSRNSASLRGDHNYFFSHFKYAQKGIEVDESGRTLLSILNAIRQVFPLQEEIDQGVYIGLYELHRLVKTNPALTMPDDWMMQVLNTARMSFVSSHLVHDKAKVQWEHVNPGATWSAPSAMSNFLRELHVRNGGKLNLPYHGDGAKMGIEAGNIAPGLFPEDV